MPDIVIIPAGEGTPLSPTSSGFAHGFGLFETMRYAEGRLYFWKDHWTRLVKSAKQFALVLPKEEGVLAALRQHVVDSGLAEATLKLSLLKGDSGSQLYVYSRPTMTVPPGRKLLLDTTCPIFPRSMLAGHKTHNYMESMYLLSLARAQGYYDTVRLDSGGNLAETTTANLFFVKDGRIHTPSLDTGVLPGVTRAALLRASELEIEEGHYPPQALQAAEAVFVTNATAGVQRIEQIVGFSDGAQADFAQASDTLSSIQSVMVRAQESRAQQLI